MKLDKFHNRLDNPADMDSEKLNRHIEAHLLGGDEHVDTYDVSVNTTSKTATARRFRPAYLSWIAVVVVVALAIALPMTLTNRGNGDGIVPPTAPPEGSNDFYCDSSQYLVAKITDVTLDKYIEVLGWDLQLPKFSSLDYLSVSKRAYISREDESTVYGISETGEILLANHDYRVLEYHIVPKNISIDVLATHSELCKYETIENGTKLHYSEIDFQHNEYVYFLLGDYKYYLKMEGSAYAGDLLGNIQQILLI